MFMGLDGEAFCLSIIPWIVTGLQLEFFSFFCHWASLIHALKFGKHGMEVLGNF